MTPNPTIRELRRNAIAAFIVLAVILLAGAFVHFLVLA